MRPLSRNRPVLKDCEQSIDPPKAQSRYFSDCCAAAARHWRKVKASRCYRASVGVRGGGSSTRSYQQRRRQRPKCQLTWRRGAMVSAQPRAKNILPADAQSTRMLCNVMGKRAIVRGPVGKPILCKACLWLSDFHQGEAKVPPTQIWRKRRRAQCGAGVNCHR